MANLLKTLASTIISTSNLVNTIAVRTDSIADHTLGSLDELSESMHDAAKMSKLSDMARRRRDFIAENKDTDVPDSLQKLLEMEIN